MAGGIVANRVANSSALIAACVALLFVPGEALAQARRQPAPAEPAPAAAPAQPQQVSAGLRKLNSAVRGEKYVDAKTEAEKLIQTGKPADKLAATLAYGRILLALEMTKETTAYLRQMRGLNLAREGDKQLLDVYQAWLDAQNGNADAAVKSLQDMLKRGLPVDSTADAADVLAILQLQQGNATQAQASVDFGLKLIEFHTLKPPYQEALLKRRIAQSKKDTPPPSGEAVAIYKKAEELRVAGKFRDAAPYYQQIAANHKESEWAPAAEFRLGQCLAGLGTLDKAKEHWQAFLKAKPDGPWRGQAHVELIDIALEHEIDLAAAAQQAEIAQSALSSITDADAKASWDAAAFELHLRSALVALAQDRRGEGATHFENAKRAPGAPASSSAVLRLDALIASLKADEDPLPSELRGPRNDEQVNILLTLGSAYNRLARHDAAQRIFTSLVQGRLQARQPVQRSFATTGLGIAQHGEGKLADAAKSYAIALATHKNGTWHDATLYRSAALVHQTATKAAATAASQAAARPARGSARSTTPTASPAEQAVARAKRTRAEAQKYWTDLLARYKESPYRETALHGSALAAIDAENWPQAAALFGELARDFPEGDRTGDALVQLIDIELERNFQIAAAEAHAQTALNWLDTQSKPRGSGPAGNAIPTDLATLFPSPEIKPTTYAVHLRTGLIAYLKQDFATAAAAFEKAKPFEPPRNFTVVHGTIPTGTERLIATAKEGKSLTPQSVREGDETAALILMLADIYHDAQQYERSLELCNRALDPRTAKPKPTQRSYALFRRGRNHYAREDDRRDPEAAQQDYLAAQRTDPKAEWAAESLFLAANIYWNHGDQSNERARQQSADRAINVWKQQIRQYPEGRESDRAAYFIGTAYELSSRHREARIAYEESRNKFPASRFNNLVEKHLNKLGSLK